ncbi:MAG: 3'(2'),5'-bisphosphate nucleotidase [Cyanobacteria bacterium P01_A01_bin.37]
MAYQTEKAVAIDAARAAATLCERVRHTISPEAIEKKDKSPVTIADFGAQAIICRAIAEAFPNDPIVGEEDAAELRTPEMSDRLSQVTSFVQEVLPEATTENVPDWIDRGNGSVAERFWTLDPIDGTKGFLRKDQYAIALALIDKGEVKVGVLVCPALTFEESQEPGLLFVAVRGEGTTMMPLAGGEAQPTQVVSPDETDKFRFVESVESGHGDHSRQEAVAKAAGITTASLRMDSQAKYAAVAAGQAALYLRLPSPKSPNYREKIWDHAAGSIVVEEAGGRVTDMHGNPLDFAKNAKLVDNQGVIVSNGPIHDQALEALKKTPASAVS